MSAPNDKKTSEPVSFATFLEEVPPGAERKVSDLYSLVHTHPPRGLPPLEPVWRLNTPDIRLHCPTETCGGVRTFECDDGYEEVRGYNRANVFFTYTCCNCKKSIKTYALQIAPKEKGPGSAVKYGERPAFGSQLPNSLLKMVGDDSDLLLKGRITENQGLGIGAFAYYRRVVENHKNRLLAEIRKAAVRLGADEELLYTIDLAIGETQFSKSLDLVKGAIPDGLKVEGDNPLKLLHGALSKAVHELSDEECLERAHAVRVVLTKLVSNIAHILKDEREVKAAVKKLRSVK